MGHFKSFQDSKIASLEDVLQKVNGELKTQEVPKTKNNKADVTATTHFYFSLPECLCFSNCLSCLYTLERLLNSYFLK